MRNSNNIAMLNSVSIRKEALKWAAFSSLRFIQRRHKKGTKTNMLILQ